LYIIDSGDNAARMREVLAKMTRFAHKLICHEPIGSPKEEGYIPRGLIRDQFVEKTAGERLIDMAMAKLLREPFETEMAPASFAAIPKPLPVKDLRKAKLMLITDGGLVPKGNPDKIEGSAATRWGAYDIEHDDDLRGEDYEISHGGYDPQFVRQDPDRLVPLDVMRQLEKDGAIGELCGEFISTSGLANPLSNTRRMGREMAEKVKSLGVDAVILTST
jgi:glycine reductase